MKTNPAYQQDTVIANIPIDTIPLDTTKAFGIPNYQDIPVWKTKQIETKETPDLPKFELHKSLLTKKVMSWQTIILFAIVLVVTFTKAFNQNRFRQLIMSLFRVYMSQEVVREEKVFFHRANLWLSVTHILTLSLLVFQFSRGINHLNDYTFSNYLILTLILLAMYIVKYLGAKILLYIFDETLISNEYIFNVSLYNNLFGILLIPVLMLIYFTGLNDMLLLFYVALPIFVLTYLLRIIRISILGIGYRISYLHIFLYICTLEILPLVVLYRIFVHK